MHYKLPVLGFRIGDLTYITDAKTISEKEKEKIKGTKILIVNALRKTPHLSHFNLEEALNFIAEIAPEKAYLTHISHLFDKHDSINAILPNGVYTAFDGLKIPFNY
jgi:phosphoribosyl 1,2-cyclic phosphate phosphodiesterase